MSETNFQYTKVFDGWLFDHHYEDDVRFLISHYLEVCVEIQEIRTALNASLRQHGLDLSTKKRLHNHLSALNVERNDVIDELLIYRCDYFEGEQGYEFTRRRHHGYDD
jgi:hypothetical protein